MNDRRNRDKESDKDQHRINDAITASEVRLTGDNVTQGIYPIDEALRIADRIGLDLVEIAAEANPPVCRVIDYQKFIYQKRKKLKEQKNNSVKVVIKEIRFGPQTDEHDYNFKLKHARSFIADGAKVKAYVFFRGRSILFKDQGEMLLLRFATDLEDIATVESMPSLEGKRMFMMLTPKKGKQGGQKNAPKKVEPTATERENN